MNFKEEILNRTNRGLDVFTYYMPVDFAPKRNFRNPFYEDKRASCNIYFDSKNDCYRMKDFGDELYSGDCFWFVAMVAGLDVRRDFRNVLQMINRDLGLNLRIDQETVVSNMSRKRPSNRVTPQVTSEAPKRYDFTSKAFSQRELMFWFRYGITEEVLRRFHVKALTCFKSVNREGKPYSIYSNDEDPMFGYVMQGFIKVYRPHSSVRFLYGGEKVDDYVFGLEQLSNKGDVVYITGGEKDVMSLSAHGFNAICFNSETSDIPKPLMELLSRRFRHIVILYDVDETGIRASYKVLQTFSELPILRLELPLDGGKEQKDISDFFSMGRIATDLKGLLAKELNKLYANTLMMMKSCEIDYNNPPEVSNSIVSVNGVPLGTQDNLFCITGGEGTGKSNYISAILSGVISNEPLEAESTLGLRVSANPKKYAVLHYDTEQSEAQLHKNLGRTLSRAGLDRVPSFFHSFYLASLSRQERLKLIRDSMDMLYHKYNGIQLVVIDGIADLIRSANDESESIAVVDELYRLAGIYNTCIICVLHFVPNGVKLRGHIGSELQRKAAGILSIEKDDNPELSVVKALKVRDGSPLDVPMMLFGWDKELDMFAYRGEKSKAEKEKRKTVDLVSVAKEILKEQEQVPYSDLVVAVMEEMDVKDRTAKKYIAYMREQNILSQDSTGNYIRGKLCHAS
ncbi:bifunctional DNA primase/helicase [Porphyromonadaceae bacterium W3.11]|nr:bifunctional DNA primase/helicase [Porphyromonadaceae bacterium W3.11]